MLLRKLFFKYLNSLDWNNYHFYCDAKTVIRPDTRKLNRVQCFNLFEIWVDNYGLIWGPSFFFMELLIANSFFRGMYWAKSSLLGIMWNVLTEEQSCTDYAVFLVRHHFLLEDGIMFLIMHIEDVKGCCAVLTKAVCLVGICTEASFWEWQGKQVYLWCWRWIWVMDSWVSKGRIRKYLFLRNVKSPNERTQKYWH